MKGDKVVDKKFPCKKSLKIRLISEEECDMRRYQMSGKAKSGVMLLCFFISVYRFRTQNVIGE